MAPLRFRYLPGLLALGALAACGSRSQLQSPLSQSEGGGGDGGTGGTGGATTTTTGTTTTSEGGGGTGGVPMGPCAELSFITPYISLQGGMQTHQRSPKLAYSNPQKARVTMASAWQATQGPANPPIELRHTSFDPWGDLPGGTSLGPTYLADLDAGVSAAIAQGPGDMFAMLHRDFQQPPPGGLRFSGGFKPNSGDIPASFLLDPQAVDAMFVAFNEKEWGYGAQDAQPNGLYETRIGVMSADLIKSEFPVACTSARTFADAVGTADGFLAAIGTADPGSAGCDFGVPTPPGGPLVVRLVGGALVNLAVLDSKELVDLRMAPRNGGAWIVWYDAGSADFTPSLWITAIAVDGPFLVPPISMPTSCNAGSLAVASFEDFLMVGCIAPEPEGASAYVQVFDPDGIARGATTVPASGAALGRAALLGSPIGRGAVLAWSETAGIGDQIRVTRVDCLEAP